MDYPLVSIISINYNQIFHTCEMLESLGNCTYPNKEIIIVDNNSEDDTSIIKQKYPDVKLIISKKNLGFAGGNNLGILEAKGDYILFLNNDTLIDPGFIQPMVDVFREHANVGLVSPKVIYHDTNIIQYAGTTKMNKYTAQAFTLNYQEEDKGQSDAVVETSFGMGTAMMTSMEVIKNVSLIPDVFFIYYEEIDWSEKIRKNGYKIFYAGNSKIYHKDSISIGQDSPLRIYYLTRNRILFIRRNRSVLEIFLSFVFILFFAMPKHCLIFLFKGELRYIRSYIKGMIWNILNYNIHYDPVLKQNKNGKNEIVNRYKKSSTR